MIIKIGEKVSLLISILSKKRFFITALITFIGYILIYLAATQHLVFTARIGEAESFFAFKILNNWQELIFRQRSPFLFEPIGSLYIGPTLKLFLSVPNIILAMFLGTLVSANVVVSYFSFRNLALKGIRGFSSLLGTIPAIVSGAACCVPTLILVIGLQLTSTLVAVWSFFVPLSILLLSLSLWWSLYKIGIKKL